MMTREPSVTSEQSRWYTIVYQHEWCSITVSVKAKSGDDALVEAKELLRENGYGRLIKTRVVNDDSWSGRNGV